MRAAKRVDAALVPGAPPGGRHSGRREHGGAPRGVEAARVYAASRGCSPRDATRRGPRRRRRGRERPAHGSSERRLGRRAQNFARQHVGPARVGPGGQTAASTQAPSIVATVRDINHQLGRRRRGVHSALDLGCSTRLCSPGPGGRSTHRSGAAAAARALGRVSRGFACASSAEFCPVRVGVAPVDPDGHLHRRLRPKFCALTMTVPVAWAHSRRLSSAAPKGRGVRGPSQTSLAPQRGHLTGTKLGGGFLGSEEIPQEQPDAK